MAAARRGVEERALTATMTGVFRGFGTVVNIVTVIAGSGLGLALGSRLPERTRTTVTSSLGLVTILIGGLSCVEITSPDLLAAVGPSAPLLGVLGSLLVGGILGSLCDLEAATERFGDWLRRTLVRERCAKTPNASDDDATGSVSPGDTSAEHKARARFVNGFVSASLVFCVGPLAILGSLSDGLGLGAEQLILKSVLDGFAAIAFAASLGPGVMASAIAVGVFQGTLTLLGALLGSIISAAAIAAITATGGLLLIGIGVRLLDIKQVPVANMLPALLVAPLLTALVAALR
jgi:uncharacterized membrane protein YqgA involved in biofilm formation